MSVLAIDTASRRRVVCVSASRDGELLDAAEGSGDAMASVLPPALARLCDSELSAVVVVRGPGSYTGLRAGIAAAVGVAVARSLPLFGIGSLDVVFAGSPSGLAVRDAGRGWVYAAPTRASMPVRTTLAALPGGAAITTVDPALSPPCSLAGHAASLAAAVPRALSSPPLSPDGISAVLVT
ncbi:MAG: tRNA (adenosine(37)-N6)-threonylcarbamoyltransferase complex dimerization subunit type 1 TsaB [Candidatus Eremiobacteraeota bacterium]|nr:tRNA (adenosine(37)-N6)-threonylcarbamoyltransferase complex dimerization subunit type 1 TsaB [Candidatus Eremiobacteraeota bacterium]